ncbi:MAG: hypothetical protein AAGH92_05000 [Planctomycetota bacterium]
MGLGQATPLERVLGEPDTIADRDLNVIGGLAATTDGAIAVRGTDLQVQQSVPFPANGGARLAIVVEAPTTPIVPELVLQAFDFTPTNAASPLSSLRIADDRTLAYRNTDPADDPLLLRAADGTTTTALREGGSLPAALNLPGTTWDEFGLVRLVDRDTFLVSATYTDGQSDTYAPQGITGTRFDQGLFRYDAGAWSSIIQTGHPIVGLSGDEATLPYHSLGSSTFRDLGNLAASTDGTHWIGALDMDPTAYRVNVNTQPIQDQLLVDNAAVTALPTGGFLREEVAVPDSLLGGQSGYDWYDFTNPAINNDGAWVVAGEITNGSGFETLILSGSGSVVENVLLRSGDTVESDLSGTATFGNARSGELALNNDGDIAVLWGDSLIVNGREVAAVGSPILDEAGAPADSLGILTTSALALSDRNDVGEVTLHFYGRLPGELNTQSDIYRLVLPLAATGLLGDYDDSGQVEQGDLNLVLNNWGGTAPFASKGDPFSTPQVDQEELNRVLNNWGNSSVIPVFSEVFIPEPTASLGLWGGLIAAGHRLARKRVVVHFEPADR